MDIDLNSVGMKKGQQYEIIISTINNEKLKDASPFGLVCKDNNIIINRIFEGSKTLENILEEKQFVVNITLSPKLFTYSILDMISEDDYTEDTFEGKPIAILKDSDAYLKCKVIDIKEKKDKTDSIKTSDITTITSEVCEIVIKNENAKPLNRAIHCLIDSLINYSRIDLIDKDKQKEYIDNIQESKRIINKVGSNEEKESMNTLIKKLKDKGFDVN